MSAQPENVGHDRYWPPAPSLLSSEQFDLYDRIVHSPSRTGPTGVNTVDDRGALVGPFSLMLITPGIGSAVNDLGVALRTCSVLSPRDRELCILCVAANFGSEFEWSAHAPAARHSGITDKQLSALRSGTLPKGLSEQEREVIIASCAVLQRRTLSANEYQRAVEILGQPRLAEIVWLCGYYSMLAVALNVFSPPAAWS